MWQTRFLDGRLVVDDHPTTSREDLFRKRTRLARASIHVNSGEDGDRGYLPGLLVPHLMKEPDHLLAHLEYAGLNGDDIPGAQLPLVRSILLNARHPAIVLAKERGSQADPREDMPGGLVELADIPHHVHVSHLVALPGSEVEVELEIKAKVPEGAPEAVVRTVSENAKTLKFRPGSGFEQE